MLFDAEASVFHPYSALRPKSVRPGDKLRCRHQTMGRYAATSRAFHVKHRWRPLDEFICSCGSRSSGVFRDGMNPAPSYPPFVGLPIQILLAWGAALPRVRRPAQCTCWHRTAQWLPRPPEAVLDHRADKCTHYRRRIRSKSHPECSRSAYTHGTERRDTIREAGHGFTQSVLNIKAPSEHQHCSNEKGPIREESGLLC